MLTPTTLRSTSRLFALILGVATAIGVIGGPDPFSEDLRRDLQSNHSSSVAGDWVRSQVTSSGQRDDAGLVRQQNRSLETIASHCASRIRQVPSTGSISATPPSAEIRRLSDDVGGPTESTYPARLNRKGLRSHLWLGRVQV